MGECVQRRKIKIVMTFWLYNLELRLQLQQSALWNNSLLQCLFFFFLIRGIKECVLGCKCRHPSLFTPFNALLAPAVQQDSTTVFF